MSPGSVEALKAAARRRLAEIAEARPEVVESDKDLVAEARKRAQPYQHAGRFELWVEVDQLARTLGQA